ncbi:hypothetical protein FLACHUCJ7_00033 [Flavobacterium chungangense]|uniref:Ig-like domain-containing protein n=1 Tax=Flavobacterium chungangense TaxID=554283 RepID=A0A6V6YLQ7_9FLAO|nr:hypothetical protein FLACHUCJ7_00033 [Flavobacterium chungangense]
MTYTYWTNAGATTAYGTPTAATAGTYYIKGTTAAGCFAISPVTVTVNANLTASVSIAASPTGTICSGTSVTFTATATNSGTTPVYQWKVNGVDAGTNSSTFTSTTLSNGDVVRVIMTSNASPCLTGSPATSNAVTMAVNPRPTPTFTTPALAQTCAGPHMTYTTQQGQSNYVWTVSGVRDTDYIIRGQGTSTDNYIVIEWLTAGSKTVTVNYNNSNGCNGAAAVYATNVTVIDRGQVNGGRENLCKSDPLPTLTLHSIAGNAVPYTVDPSLVVKWQYNDDINNSAATWFDIPDPQNVMNNVTYTPQAFPGAFRTYRVLLQNGSCTEESIESRIRILAFNAPTLGTTTYPTCSVSTGSVVLNNLPSGNWTINQIGTVAAAYTNVVPNTTSYTITGLATGSYTFTVSEGSCTSDASLTLNMSQAVNTWDGTKWSKTGDTTLPVADDKIVFEGNYTLSTNLTGCSCTVNTGNVVVNSGITLTITNAVIVNGGTLTFENNASLMQTTNAVNSGAIIYKRTSFPMKNFDATYWSSPVVGQTLVGLSPNTLSDKYIAYYDSAWKTEARTNVMKPGIGYAIRVPKPNYWPIPTAPTYAQPVEFKGVPNNGNITSSQAVTAGKYYLIGNPYPSALDAREFLYSNANNNAVLNGTIYFWTHNTGISPSGGKYVYSSNDYASFNATGGTATTGANNAIPSGYIAAGQSFMASAKANGTVQFDNSMRVGGADNAQFFKPGKSSKSAGFESHRLWLNMTNSEGAFKQTLIGYVEGATNSYDVNFDGETFDGNTYIDFYSVNTTNKLTIQGRALPFTNTDLVPLGYRSTIAGDFTISIDKADGNLATQRVYLEDKQTGTVNELTAGNYVFTTKAGTFNDRFVLRYSANTLGTGDFEVADDAVWVKIANKTVSVNSTSENIDKVFIYDLSGKQLYVKEDVNNLQLLIENLPFAQQVLLVKVVLDNGYQTTKKVVFN